MAVAMDGMGWDGMGWDWECSDARGRAAAQQRSSSPGVAMLPEPHVDSQSTAARRTRAKRKHGVHIYEIRIPNRAAIEAQKQRPCPRGWDAAGDPLIPTTWSRGNRRAEG